MPGLARIGSVGTTAFLVYVVELCHVLYGISGAVPVSFRDVVAKMALGEVHRLHFDVKEVQSDVMMVVRGENEAVDDDFKFLMQAATLTLTRFPVVAHLVPKTKWVRIEIEPVELEHLNIINERSWPHFKTGSCKSVGHYAVNFPLAGNTSGIMVGPTAEHFEA